MFYDGALAPVDMCMHLHCHDLNWGDMAQCALGLREQFGVPEPRHGVAYTELLRLFALGKEQGIVPGVPQVYINGKRSTWPSYPPTLGPTGSLLGEVCAAFKTPPKACLPVTRSVQLG